ncbi:hypothetical protein PFMALIP_06259, partial [Plasmodium falciparum MaliPS096_E11]
KYIYAIEKGKITPSISEIKKLETILGVPLKRTKQKRGGCASHKKFNPNKSRTFTKNLKNNQESVYTYIQSLNNHMMTSI